MPSIKIGNKEISFPGDEIYLIAELGQNHLGNINKAKLLMSHASFSNFDCVKFQKSCLVAKYTKAALDRPHRCDLPKCETYGEHQRLLEFSEEQYYDLQNFSKVLNVDFAASAMDLVSLHQLNKFNMPFIKIGSGDANNFPLLFAAAKLSVPLIISIGMQTMRTVERIVSIMRSENKTNFVLMHCVSSYPTYPADAGLMMIPFLQRKFPKVAIGYSGHEMGVNITQAAILLGARIIERHYTSSRELSGSDHISSITTSQLNELMYKIDEFRRRGYLRSETPISRYTILENVANDNNELHMAMLPIYEKAILPCELKCKMQLGKSVVAKIDLRAGERVSKRNVDVKISAPSGVRGEDIDMVVGRVLINPVRAECPIMYSDVVSFIERIV